MAGVSLIMKMLNNIDGDKNDDDEGDDDDDNDDNLKGRLDPPVSDEKSSHPFHRSVGSPRE